MSGTVTLFENYCGVVGFGAAAVDQLWVVGISGGSVELSGRNGFSVPVPEGGEKEVEERKMPTSSTVIGDADRGVQLEVLIEGAGPDVILVPSALRGLRLRCGQDLLARAGYRTIAVNPRGAGKSTGPSMVRLFATQPTTSPPSSDHWAMGLSTLSAMPRAASSPALPRATTRS